MSSLFGNDWASGPARASRWGHSGPTIIVGILGAMASLALLPVTYPTGSRPLISVTFLVLMLVTWFEMRKHDRGLCERCVADFPLNPAESAVTHRRKLATVHLLADRRAATYYLLGILVACLLPVFAPGPLKLPAMALWLASLASIVYLVRGGQMHRRLQPWCPQCGNQGGEDQVEAPEPMPMGGLSR